MVRNGWKFVVTDGAQSVAELEVVAARAAGVAPTCSWSDGVASARRAGIRRWAGLAFAALLLLSLQHLVGPFAGQSERATIWCTDNQLLHSSSFGMSDTGIGQASSRARPSA